MCVRLRVRVCDSASFSFVFKVSVLLMGRGGCVRSFSLVVEENIKILSIYKELREIKRVLLDFTYIFFSSFFVFPFTLMGHGGCVISFSLVVV